MKSSDQLLLLIQSIVFIILGLNMVTTGMPTSEKVEVFQVGSNIEEAASENPSEDKPSAKDIRKQTTKKKSHSSNVLGTLALFIGFLELTVLSLHFVMAK